MTTKAKQPAFLARRGASDLDRPAWLSERRNGITATEVAKLGSYKSNAGRTKALGTMADDKIAASADDWRGARMDLYRKWGKEREPVLEEWASFAFGFTPESRIAWAEKDRQHLASVDGWRMDSDGSVHLSELKTTNKPLTHDIADEKGYVDQCQWQMWVTDAVDDLILWEERLDDPDSDGFIAGVRGTLLIVRDEERIAQLVSYATAFLLVLMYRLTGSDGSIEDPMLDDIVTRLQDAKATVAELDPQVRDMMTTSGMTSAKTTHWNVSHEASDPKPVPDLDAFAKAHPEQVARLSEIMEQRRTHRQEEIDEILEWQSQYTKLGEATKPTLRITVRKDTK